MTNTPPPTPPQKNTTKQIQKTKEMKTNTLAKRKYTIWTKKHDFGKD